MGEVVILPVVRIESEGLQAQERQREEMMDPARAARERNRRQAAELRRLRREAEDE